MWLCFLDGGVLCAFALGRCHCGLFLLGLLHVVTEVFPDFCSVVVVSPSPAWGCGEYGLNFEWLDTSSWSFSTCWARSSGSTLIVAERESDRGPVGAAFCL